jgi:hypothetical protein
VFEETLVRGAKNSLALLGKSGILRNAYLAGGTAAALQMGHRISVDFDFFTQERFVPQEISKKLSHLGSFVVDQADKGTVLGKFEKVKFSLFVYEYPLIEKTHSYLEISLASLQDIAAMKIDALSSRGARRDFVDLYFLCRQGLSLTEILTCYQKKYGLLASNLIHIQKSLIYFKDAETDDMPKMLKEVKWEQIQRFFEQEVKRLMPLE